MLAAVMPMVDAATASGAEVGRSFPHMLAFNLFGLGVAFFQSAHTLINDHQTVQALPALRALTIIAARFEQISDEGGPGLGLVIHMALSALDDLAGLDPELRARRREEVLEGAALLGIPVPDQLPGPETSGIYASLNAEMQLAQSAVNGAYGAVALHVERTDDEHVGFHTRLEPGPLTEMVASACVMAQLELLKRAGKLLGWAIDEAKIDDLLTRARELNEVSADPGSSVPISTNSVG
jgi:hypothetical protein